MKIPLRARVELTRVAKHAERVGFMPEVFVAVVIKICSLDWRGNMAPDYCRMYDDGADVGNGYAEKHRRDRASEG